MDPSVADAVDFAMLRSDHVRLFASALRLETRFSKSRAATTDFDKDEFCEQFPTAFTQADGEVQKLSVSVQQVAKHVTRMSERLLLSPQANEVGGADEEDGAQALASAARQLGLQPTVGHVAAQPKTFAVDAGLPSHGPTRPDTTVRAGREQNPSGLAAVPPGAMTVGGAPRVGAEQDKGRGGNRR